MPVRAAIALYLECCRLAFGNTITVIESGRDRCLHAGDFRGRLQDMVYFKWLHCEKVPA